MEVQIIIRSSEGHGSITSFQQFSLKFLQNSSVRFSQILKYAFNDWLKSRTIKAEEPKIWKNHPRYQKFQLKSFFAQNLWNSIPHSWKGQKKSNTKEAFHSYFSMNIFCAKKSTKKRVSITTSYQEKWRNIHYTIFFWFIESI